MLENNVVDRWDVQGGEHGDESGHDCPEQKLVSPDISGPLREVILTVWLHAEERSSHINHLPRKEEGEPGEAYEGGCAGAEHGVASSRVAVVAAFAEITVAEPEEHQGER